MQFVAKAKYVLYSPYKLRPIAHVVRGKDVTYALNWLATYRNRRVEPLQKVLQSAFANAKNLGGAEGTLIVKEIRVDQGPIRKYFKPGAMGRAVIQRTRLSHLSVILESIAK